MVLIGVNGVVSANEESERRQGRRGKRKVMVRLCKIMYMGIAVYI